MYTLDKIYIDGEFSTPHGDELFDMHNPTTGASIGHVRLADQADARRAVDAAANAFPSFSRTSKAERIDLLRRLHAAIMARAEDLRDATVQEYGGLFGASQWRVALAADSFLAAAATLESYDFTRKVGSARVIREAVGVAGLITPWNNNCGSVSTKLSAALAAGCTTVIKPSELSALQASLLTECFHAADVPRGAINVVNGRGDVVGAELSANPKVAKISFTGSTAVGKTIIRAGAESIKRVTLELGGKSATVVLDDADLDKAVAVAVAAGFGNNGQACVNGTRILVPQSLAEPFCAKLKTAVEAMKVGDPSEADTVIGPLVSRTQLDRVEHYIRLGLEQGAELVTGGPGRPEGLPGGYFVKPTVFSKVTSSMAIAQEEIFGPVVAVMTYKSEDEAIEIANGTIYGLQAYVVSADAARAQSVADRLLAGRVLINGAPHDPEAPFGGFKQSGIGREYGVFGLESFTEVKAVLAPAQ